MTVQSPAWLVITTKSRAEKRVRDGLINLGITHFLPIQRQLRQWKDRKKWVDVVILGGYIFINIEEKYKNKVFEIPGVVNFLKNKEALCKVADSEIDRLMRICNYESEIQIFKQKIEQGERVEVIMGALQGLKGTVIEKMNNCYLNVLIESIGCTATFKIDRSNLRKIVK